MVVVNAGHACVDSTLGSCIVSSTADILGQIHATSHSSMMINCRNPSTVQDGRKSPTQISYLHLEASRTCVRSQSWTLSSRTPNTARSVLVPTQSWYHKLYFSDDVLTL